VEAEDEQARVLVQAPRGVTHEPNLKVQSAEPSRKVPG